jgi:glycerol kinase
MRSSWSTFVSDGPRSADTLILAIDQGTTNTKALLASADGTVHAFASRPVGIAYPQPGWVEQDAERIWSATREAALECLAQAGDPAVAGIAISTQRESAVAWSAGSGKPVGPVLGWQDARTPDLSAMVALRSGLRVDPMYSAPKMRWLLDAALAGGADVADLQLGTIDSWLCWNLTGAFLAEAGNASRTLLLDLETLGWHAALLEVFGIPPGALAPVVRSDGGFGTTTLASGLPEGIPVLAVMADSHAAMLAQGCADPGDAKATYGTGSSVMTPAADLRGPRPEGLATTLAWLADRPVYAYEGNIVASGAALEWMSRILGLSGGAELSDLAATAPSSEGVAFVPAFAGLGAPYWDRDAVGITSGITAGTTRAHLARAAIDAVANQVADVVEAIDAVSPAPVTVLAADGGASASPVLMQAQADLLGRNVRVSDVAEASAVGAARLAFRSLGISDPDGGAAPAVHYFPDIDEQERRDRRRQWAAAVARARLVSRQ